MTSALDDYRPRMGLVDEVVDDGRVREHWGTVSAALGALGPDELHRRQDDVRRLLDADGATYRILSAERAQPWKLDAVPLLMSSSEWATIESGVIQRAVLLDLVLRDLYSERKLLHRGIIPPEIVFLHGGFVRACDGIALPDESQLFTYAADLGRNADGEFCVIGDFAQAPSGSGYALENRVVLSRVFPSLYRNAKVHRVAPFFRALRNGLETLGEHRTENPRIVVLSPGPRSETAFEHAYLASYLGYGLVEGEDLVVRNGIVHLRSLGGVEPVDVILRRVDAAYSDPLELKPESRLGVPGLLEACRRGNVVVVNTIGSGAIENPALNAFLPAAARALLGQDLRLPGVTTWWCGNDDDRRYVLDHLHELVVKPIAGTSRNSELVVPTLSRAQRERLRRRIEADPQRWAAHELVQLSTSPTLTRAGLRPRKTLLRTYAVARDGSFEVMAGGLTRVAPDDRSLVISNQTGALSKDTWVLSSEPERASLLPDRREPVLAQGAPAGRLSERAAENLYWVGRYAERAEGVVRLLRAVHDRRTEQVLVDEAGQRAVEVLLATLAATTYAAPPPAPGDEVDPADAADEELYSLACDAQRPGSLAYAVSRLLVSAEAVRDQLSIDTWQVTSALEHQLLTLSTTAPGRQDVVQGTLGSVMQALLALHGLAGESMIRDAGWYFMEAGRRIERAHHLLLLLRAALADEREPETEGLVLESMLLAAESIITYRRRYRARTRVDTVLDLLVLDEGNPRSLRYQVDRLDEALGALPVPDDAGRLTTAQRLTLQLSTAVRVADTAVLARPTDDKWRYELVAFLNDAITALEQIGADVASSSFAHHLPQRSLDEPETVIP